jgi:hypothetical protein
VFARKIKVEYDGVQCPIKWLDSFCMRSFTGASRFDDTLPVADGMIEIGFRVPLEELRAAMQDWFYRKGYLKSPTFLTLIEAENVNRPSTT